MRTRVIILFDSDEGKEGNIATSRNGYIKRNKGYICTEIWQRREDKGTLL